MIQKRLHEDSEVRFPNANVISTGGWGGWRGEGRRQEECHFTK